jgi:hypothetical protein
MARVVAAAALATAVSADTIALSISDCGSGVPGHVKDISPKSINTGSTSTITGSGTSDSDVSGGDFTLDIKALGVSLQSCKGEICSASTCDLPLSTGSIAFKGMTCPVKAGPVDIPMDVTVSDSIPSQLAVLEITLDVDGVLCAKINTKAGAEELTMADGKVDLTFEDCGDASTIGTIKDVQPRSLTLGDKTPLAGTGTLSADFPAGDFTFEAKALGVTVLSDGGDVCAPKSISLPLGVGTFDYKGNSCPIPAGAVELDFDVSLSSAIPSQIAKLDINIEATTSDGTKALCAVIHTAPGAVTV